MYAIVAASPFPPGREMSHCKPYRVQKNSQTHTLLPFKTVLDTLSPVFWNRLPVSATGWTFPAHTSSFHSHMDFLHFNMPQPWKYQSPDVYLPFRWEENPLILFINNIYLTFLSKLFILAPGRAFLHIFIISPAFLTSTFLSQKC